MGLTIYAIKAAVEKESPYFFSKSSLRFFGQSVSSFKIKKAPSGKVFIYAPSYWSDFETGKPRLMGYTIREFSGNDLIQPTVNGTDFKSVEQVKAWIKTQ